MHLLKILSDWPKLPYRMEAMAATLIETGELKYEDVVFRPKGVFKRDYSSDVLQSGIGIWRQTQKGLIFTHLDPDSPRAVVDLDANDASKELVFVDLSREGLYDMMPEGFFHATENSGQALSGDDAIHAKSQKLRSEEEAARWFFLPFEQEFFRKRIEIELQERRLLGGFTRQMRQQIFSSIWYQGSPFDDRQKLILGYILPLTSQIVGDRTRIETVFETILETEVHLRRSRQVAETMEWTDAMPLGEAILGYDLTLTGQVFDEIIGFELNVGPIRRECALNFVTYERQARVIDRLADFFLPAGVDLKTNLIFDQSENDLWPEDFEILSKKEDTSADEKSKWLGQNMSDTRLNYSTVLGEFFTLLP
jgi:type VI secretion system protein ImpH